MGGLHGQAACGKGQGREGQGEDKDRDLEMHRGGVVEVVQADKKGGGAVILIGV
jgi:hypothetical protein